MTMLVGTELGLEVIGRAAIVVLKQDLNDALSDIEAEWTVRDGQFATDMGIPAFSVELEPIPDGSFYHGRIPSLVEASVDLYPNACAFAYRAAPFADSDADHINEFEVNLDVEVMVKSLTSEEEVNSRAQRTLEAIHRVLSERATLDGLVVRIVNTPTVELSDVFTRPEELGVGTEWFWQGARLRYMVYKPVLL